jgi:membrane-bound metal-dependent hydrolase YbcI (DUF457 family)
MAQLGFRQRIGRDATWAMVAAAMLPDIDIVIGPLAMISGVEVQGTQELAYMTSHRGITHSVLVIPAMSVILTAMWAWFRRRAEVGVSATPSVHEGDAMGDTSRATRPVSFTLMLAGVWLAMMSHTFLDVCTAYGTQILSPLSYARFAIDVVPVIDLLFATILVVTLIGCAVARKVARDAKRATRRIGWIGLAVAAGYLALGGVFHHAAVARMQQAMQTTASTPSSDAADETRTSATYHANPSVGTIFVWRVTRQDAMGWHVMKVNLLRSPPVQPVIRHAANACAKEYPAIEQADALEPVRMFRWFAMDQIRVAASQRAGMDVVEFFDMRYALRPDDLQSLWSVRAVRDGEGSPWQVESVHTQRNGRLKHLALQWWRDLQNP